MLSLKISRDEMPNKIFWVILFLFLLCFQTISCSRQVNEPMVKMKGLNDMNDIVFLYKKNTTYEERQNFQNSVLYKPNEGRGQAHQDGIVDLMLGRIIDDYEGGLINFSPNAISEQREKIIKAIRESSKVHRVYENIVPSQIKDL